MDILAIAELSGFKIYESHPALVYSPVFGSDNCTEELKKFAELILKHKEDLHV